MSPSYGAPRLWATVLMIIWVVGVVFVAIGTIFAVSQAEIFAQGLATLLICGPLVALFASWPNALGQGLGAIADVAEYVQEQQSMVR
jgi:hypothetical protein